MSVTEVKQQIESSDRLILDITHQKGESSSLMVDKSNMYKKYLELSSRYNLNLYSGYINFTLILMPVLNLLLNPLHPQGRLRYELGHL